MMERVRRIRRESKKKSYMYTPKYSKEKHHTYQFKGQNMKIKSVFLRL